MTITLTPAFVEWAELAGIRCSTTLEDVATLAGPGSEYVYTMTAFENGIVRVTRADRGTPDVWRFDVAGVELAEKSLMTLFGNSVIPPGAAAPQVRRPLAVRLLPDFAGLETIPEYETRTGGREVLYLDGQGAGAFTYDAGDLHPAVTAAIVARMAHADIAAAYLSPCNPLFTHRG